MNNKNKTIGITFLSVALITTIILFASGVFAPSPISTEDSSTATINYHSQVCKQITRADGTIEEPECSHNVLYTDGANYIRKMLTLGSASAADNITNISLCNAVGTGGCTTPVAADVAIGSGYNELTGGLAPKIGTVLNTGNGNWSVSATFTSTADNVQTNVTRITNGTITYPFAGNSFTLATLQTNDQITVNWTIWVS